MRLTVFNGSPRGKTGNTAVLVGDLCEGFRATAEDAVDVHYLNTEKRRIEAVQAFKESDLVLLAFPLYVHAMPGIVMTWLEMLEPVVSERQVKMGFIVQGGLPEPRQSRAVEAFLERLPGRLGCEYIGTAIRGDVEMMQFAPAFMFRKMHLGFRNLGMQLASQGCFDGETIARLAGPETIPGWRRGIFRFLKAIGVADKYWETTLKKNGAFDQRFDQPHAPERS